MLNEFKQERIEFARFHKNAEKQQLPIIRKALNKQIAMVVSWVEYNGVENVPVETLIDRAVWRDLYPNMYQTVGMSMARLEYYRQRKLEGIASKGAIDFLKDVWSGKLRDAAIEYITGIENKLNQTTIELVRKALTNGYETGLDRLGRIRIFNREIMDINKGRGLDISRTEVTTIANLGKEIAAKSWIEQQGGNEGYKVWLGRIIKERETHIETNDTILPMNDKYDLQGDLADRPGDVNLLPKNRINCFLPDQLTSQAKTAIKKSIRSFYEGEVVTIHTSGKKNFTCTPNHPILTDSGWVNAGDLKESHKLINSEDVNRGFAIPFNVKNVVSTFEQIHSSISVVGMRVRVDRRLVNLYSRTPTQDVDIVNVNRSLAYWIKSIDFKIFKNKQLSIANLRKCFCFCYGLFNRVVAMKRSWHCSYFFVSLIGKFFSFFSFSESHSIEHRLASISCTYSGSVKYSVNNVSGISKFNRKLFNAYSGLIAGDNFIFKLISRIFLILPIYKSVFFTKSGNPVGSNKKFFSNLSESEAFSSKSDNVLRVEWGRFSGHVYTFESVNQIYDINSYVASNCRCTQSLMSENRYQQYVKRNRIVDGKLTGAS